MARASICIHSLACGRTVAVERMRRVGSTKKKQRIVRRPGLLLFSSSKGCTRCCKVFGHASARPDNVRITPRGCTSDLLKP